MAQLKIDIRLFDGSGVRQSLPQKFIADWTFETLNYGGYGNGSLTLFAQQDDQIIPALPQVGWRWEVWFDQNDGNGMVPAYRGWIELQRPPITDQVPTYVYESVGLMGRCSKFLVNSSFAKPYGGDVSTVFAWLAQEFLQGSDRLPLFTTAIQNPIGYTVDRVDFFGQTVKQAFDNLSQAAEDTLIWGFDATPDGTDRFYVQKVVTGVPNSNNVLTIGKEITELEDSKDLSEMANAVLLTGGPSRAPNKVYNPSFELPDAPGYGHEGNLVKTAGFETSSDWTYNGNAERKSGSGRPGDYARSGTSYAEFGGTGGGSDSIVQTITLPTADTVAGTPFTLIAHYAAEGPGTYTFKIKLEEYNGSSWSTLSYDTVTVASREYQEYKKSKLQIDSSITELRITFDTPSTADPNKILLDDIWLYVDDVLVQDGWTSQDYGTAQSLVDWANYGDDPGYDLLGDAGAYDGVYFIRVHCNSGQDGTNANSTRVRQTNDHWAQTRGRNNFKMRCWVRVAAGSNLTLTPGILRKHQNGKVDHVYGSAYTTLGTGDWEKVEVTVHATQRITEIRPQLEFNSVGIYDIDAIQLFEDGQVDSNTFPFTPTGNVQFYFRADEPVSRSDLQVHASTNTKVKSVALPFSAQDIGKVLRVTSGSGWTLGDYHITAYDGSAYVTLDASPAATSHTGGIGTTAFLIDLSTAAQASIAAYGLREQAINVPAIVDDVQQSGDPNTPVLSQAITYCTGWLNRYAVPLEQCKVTVDGPQYHYRIVDPNDATAADQGQFRILGTKNSISDQWPARFVYSMQESAILRVEMDLSNRRPDPALLLMQTLGSFGSGNAASANVATPGGGAASRVANTSGPEDTSADTGTPNSQFDIALYTGDGAQVTNAIPTSGLAYWSGSVRKAKAVDTSNYTQARIHFYVSSSTANGYLTLQYSTDGGTTWREMDGGTGMHMALSSTGVFVSPWVELEDAAIGEIIITGAVGGGTGSNTATLNSFHAQFS